MKLVWHLVILVCLVLVCASVSLAQQSSAGGGGAVLSLSANVTTASILEVSSKSDYIEEVETTSPAVRTLRVTLLNSQAAGLIKETPAGTLLMAKVEFLVRFSGYKEETATVLITVGPTDASSSLSLIEGRGEETLKAIALGQVIKIEGVRSGSRIIRYVGFRRKKTNSVTPNENLSAQLTYELTH
jgi:hypothetical protein